MAAAGVSTSRLSRAPTTPLDPFGGWQLAATRAAAPDQPALRRLPEALLARTRLPRGCAGEHRGGMSGFVAIMHILRGQELGRDVSGTAEFLPGDLIVWTATSPRISRLPATSTS